MPVILIVLNICEKVQIAMMVLTVMLKVQMPVVVIPG
jgi:hypothetical protein